MRPLFVLETYTAFVTALPGVHIVEQWNSHVAKVGDKVFALLHQESPNGPYLVLKFPQDEFELVTMIAGVGQAPYFPKGQWIRLTHETSLPDDEIAERLHDSYGIIAAKLTRKARAELGIDDSLLVR